MSHRTQITLEDGQYARLMAESASTGLSLAELVRRAVDRTYRLGPDERRSALDLSFGAWPVELDGEEYVERLRGGLAHRLESR